MSIEKMIGGPICHGVVDAAHIDHEDRALSVREREVLWELFVEIGRCWGNLADDSLSVKSSWLELIEAKIGQAPHYTGEYANAVIVLQELITMYGREKAYAFLFLRNGIPDGPPTTRLAHTKKYVVDEFIRVQIVAGGFQGFVTPAPVNYGGFIYGSRYNRTQRSTPYVPGTDPEERGDR